MPAKKKTQRKAPAKKKARGKGGRPSKYNKRFADQLEKYFDIEAGYDAAVEVKGALQSVRHAADFPTLAGFACSIGVHRETLLNWAATDSNGKPIHPEFFDAYKRAHDHQERILVQNGLKGGYQPSFAIFTAKNVLGWRDKQEHEHSGPDGGPIQIKTIERKVVDPRN